MSYYCIYNILIIQCIIIKFKTTKVINVVFSHFIINIAFKSYLNKTLLNYFLFNNNFNHNFNQIYNLYQLTTIKRDFSKFIFFKLQLQYHNIKHISV
jgi:hypothetical protein